MDRKTLEERLREAEATTMSGQWRALADQITELWRLIVLEMSGTYRVKGEKKMGYKTDKRTREEMATLQLGHVQNYIKLRDRAKELLKEAGAFRADKIVRGSGIGSHDSYQLMGWLDTLVEQGVVKEITPKDSAGQFRVFTH